jgi:DNA-binding NarL/FixJ family response regulator
MIVCDLVRFPEARARTSGRPKTSPLSTRVVIVVRLTPGHAAISLQLFNRGMADSVVGENALHDLPQVLERTASGWRIVTQDVVMTAAEAPLLSERQVSILALLLRGNSDGAISRILNVSVATTKRELATMRAELELPNRVALASYAAQLGYGAALLKNCT